MIRTPLRERAVYRALRLGRVVGPAMLRYRLLEARDARGRSDAAAWARNHDRLAAGLAALGEDLGGFFVKMCQVAGARGDVLPAAFVRELGRFHDRVTPRPFAELSPGVEQELDRPLDQVFASVDPEALAAASLAQVHRARLRSGEEVVLKIQYPEAAALYRVDLGLVRRAVGAAARLFPSFPMRGPVEDVAHFIGLELDFLREADSTDRVRAALTDDASVVVPRLHRELCTPRVLVLEFLDGTPIHDTAALAAQGVSLPGLADRVAALYGRMLFEESFFQGDPHPGNLLVLRDGRLGLLDFGLAKELPPGFAAGMTALFAAAGRGDRDGALDAARAVGFRFERGDPDAFAKLLQIFLGARHDLAELRATAFASALDAVPPDIALVFRTMILLNGLSERLAPGERRIPRKIVGALATPSAAKPHAVRPTPPTPLRPMETARG